jgi:hypothetical protein
MQSLKKKIGSTAAKILQFLYYLGFGVALFVTAFGLMVAFSNYQALATASPWPVNSNGLPDFTRVSSSNFTTFSKDQCFTVPPSATHLLGTTDFCVKAGDSFAALPVSILNSMSGVGQEKITDMLTKGGIDPSSINLDKLPFIEKVSSKELFDSLNLSQSPVSNVLKQQLQLDGLPMVFGTRGVIPTNQTVFSNFPQIANNPLNGNLSLNSFSELGNSKLSDVAGALKEKISSYPGLANRPFTSFPNPPSIPAVPTFIKMDKILKKENISRRVSTGSLQNRSIPCANQCDGIEVTGATPNSLAAGTTAVSGDSQETNSGFGFLGGLNIGREPTGDFPFGEMYKESIHNVSASAGTANRAFNFRVCDRGGFLRPDLGCTKYFIGPIVFGEFSENGHELALMGNPQFSTKSVIPASLTAAASPVANKAISATSASVTNSLVNATASSSIGGVDVTKLQQAISNAGISNLSADQLKQYLKASQAKSPTLQNSDLLKQVVVDIYGGANGQTSATNPVSGESADQFARRVADAYAQTS